MNKIFLILTAFVLIFSSCKTEGASQDNVQSIQDIVHSMERIVEKYDNNVQSAIDSKNFDYILSVSKAAVDSSTVKLDNLKQLALPEEYEDLRNAAVTYINSLEEVIKTEELYSTISENTSAREAKIMDEKILSAIKQAQIEHAKYEQMLDQALNTDKE
ncbi:MAG: hypothetical protein E6772_14490 [Dysgonomonas sp.]|nr:hypothetical protein [Dysgonomonas sp.]